MADSKPSCIDENFTNPGANYNQRKNEEHYDIGEGLVLCFYNQYNNAKSVNPLNTEHDYKCINELFDKKTLKFPNGKTKVIGLPDKSCEEMKKILDAFQSGELKKCKSLCGLKDSDDLKTLREYNFLMIFFCGHGGSRGFTFKVKGDGNEIPSEGRYDFFMDSNEKLVPTQFLIDYVADKFQEQMPKKPKVLFLDCCREDFGKEKEDCVTTLSKSMDFEHVDKMAEDIQHKSGHYYVVQTTLPKQWAWDETATAMFCQIAGLKGGNGGSTDESVMDFDFIMKRTRLELLENYNEKKSQKEKAGNPKRPETPKDQLMRKIDEFQIVHISECLVKKFYLGNIGLHSGKF